MKALITFMTDAGDVANDGKTEVVEGAAAEVLNEVLNEFDLTIDNYEPGLSEPGRSTPSVEYFMADVITRFQRQTESERDTVLRPKRVQVITYPKGQPQEDNPLHPHNGNLERTLLRLADDGWFLASYDWSSWRKAIFSKTNDTQEA